MARRWMYGSAIVIIGCIVLSSPVLAKTYRFKQWIAPLECTQSRIVDGNTVKTILTPQECDDLLHPKPPVIPEAPDTDGDNPPRPDWKPETPGVPNTGFFQDPIVGFVQAGFWLLVFTGLLASTRRRKRDDLSE